MLRSLRDWLTTMLFLAVVAGGVAAISEVALSAEGPDPHTDPVQLAQAEEACVTGEDLVSYLRAPPHFGLMAELFVTLDGERAAAYLRVTGGAGLTTTPRVLYFLVKPPGYITVVLADEGGCITNMKGDRVLILEYGNPASYWAEATNAEADVRAKFEELGFFWPEDEQSKRHKPRLRPAYQPIFKTETVAI